MVVGRQVERERERWAKNEQPGQRQRSTDDGGVASVGGVNGYLASRKSGANSDG